MKPIREIPFRELFKELVRFNSVHNDFPAELYFHALMGALLKNVTIIKGGDIKTDLRISLLWVQLSRTGKGVLNKIMERICKKLNISITTVTELTTAGLIGTVDVEAIRFNQQHGLTEDVPFKKTKKGDISYQNPIIKGDLGNFDIIIIDEAKIFLEPKPFTEQLLTVLQPALDYPGWVRKKLASKYAVEYHCQPTIIGTTYHFDTMQNIVANQGFFQRIAFYRRDLSLKEILDMRRQQAVIANKEFKEQYQEKLRDFIEKMKLIPREPKELIINKEAFKELNKLREAYFEQIQKELSGSELKAALSFSNTIEELAMKIAGQYAIMGQKKEIDAVNIGQSYFTANRIVKTIINKIEIKESKENKHEINVILGELKKYDRIGKLEFYKIVGTKLNWGLNKCGKRITELINENYIIEEKGEKNEKLLVLKK